MSRICGELKSTFSDELIAFCLLEPAKKSFRYSITRDTDEPLLTFTIFLVKLFSASSSFPVLLNIGLSHRFFPRADDA